MDYFQWLILSWVSTLTWSMATMQMIPWWRHVWRTRHVSPDTRSTCWWIPSPTSQSPSVKNGGRNLHRHHLGYLYDLLHLYINLNGLWNKVMNIINLFCLNVVCFRFIRIKSIISCIIHCPVLCNYLSVIRGPACTVSWVPTFQQVIFPTISDDFAPACHRLSVISTIFNIINCDTIITNIIVIF